MSNQQPSLHEIADLFIKPLLSKTECVHCGENFGAAFANCYERNAHSFHRVNDANAQRLQVNAGGKV